MPGRLGRLILTNITGTESLLLVGILARLRDENKIADTLIIDSHGKTSISVGYYDDIDGLNLKRIKEDGVPVVRRPAGAGVYWGPERGMAIAIVTTREIFRDIDEGEREWDDGVIREALIRLGIPGDRMQYKHPGDLKLGERKIAGTGTIVRGNGISVFNFLNRLTPPTIFFSDYLIYPSEKMKDKMLKSIAEYATSLETELPRVPSEKQIAETIANVAEERLGIKFTWGDFMEEERKLLESEIEHYSKEEVLSFPCTQKWISCLPSGLVGAHRMYKSEKLLRCAVAVDSKGIIKDWLFSGDFLLGSPEDWHKLMDEFGAAGLNANDEEGIRRKIKEIFEKNNIVYSGFKLDELAQLIIDTGKEAVEKLGNSRS
jgi:lipoate-protein ligase A